MIYLAIAAAILIGLPTLVHIVFWLLLGRAQGDEAASPPGAGPRSVRGRYGCGARGRARGILQRPRAALGQGKQFQSGPRDRAGATARARRAAWLVGQPAPGLR